AEELVADFGRELPAALTAYVSASRNRARAFQRLVAASAMFFFVVAMVAVAAGVWAYREQQEAVAAEQRALAERDHAERAQQEAVAAEQRALAERDHAERAQQEAVAAEQRALAERDHAERNFKLAQRAADSLVLDLARGLRDHGVPTA